MADRVSIDIGTRFTKVYTPDRKRMVHSLVGPPPPERQGQESKYIKVPRPVIVRVDADPPFVFGLDAEKYSVAPYGPNVGPSVQEGFYSQIILALLGQESASKVNLVLGVPLNVRDYDSLAIPIEGRHSIVYAKDNQQKEVKVFVQRVDVFPSTLGSYSGEMGKIGLIDLGYSYTTLALFKDGEWVRDATTTIPPSLRRVLASIAKRKRINENVLDKRLADSIAKNREPDEDVKRYIRDFTAEVMRYATSRWKREGLDKMVLTGGGAVLVRMFLQNPRIEIVDSPIYANASGLLNMKVTA